MSTQTGQPTAAASSDPTLPPTSGSAASFRAPPVRKPLNDARLIEDPCSALSPKHLPDIGFTAATTSHVVPSPVATGCAWTDNTIGTAGATVHVGVQTTLVHGLSDIYAQRSAMVYFMPVTIDGYPAVVADTLDERDTGICALNLGVSDTSVLVLDYNQVDFGRSSCEKVQVLARAVIETLEGT